MTSASVERRTAVMHARLAQGALIIALTGAAALGVLGLPGARLETVPDALKVPDPPPRSEATSPTRPVHAVDEVRIASAASMLENTPKPPPPAQSPKAEDRPPPPPPTETRYIGLLNAGAHGIAILVDGNRQRVARVGDTIADGSRVTAISPDAIEVESGGRTRSIPMAEVAGERIGRASASTTRGTPIPAAMARNSPSPAQRADARSIALGPRPSTKRVPNTPDGSPERLEELIRMMRESGRYDSEDAATAAAKELFEAETIKYNEKGGPQ
jgi:hypothetical protein